MMLEGREPTSSPSKFVLGVHGDAAMAGTGAAKAMTGTAQAAVFTSVRRLTPLDGRLFSGAPVDTFIPSSVVACGCHVGSQPRTTTPNGWPCRET